MPTLHSSCLLRTEIERLLAEHRADRDSTREARTETLLSQLAEARNEGHLSNNEIEGQMLTMLFAGYETTAAVLGFAWYELARNPELRDAFHAELEAVLGGETPTPADISELDLTRRIVTESLRMYPPVHTIPRQTRRDIEVDGYVIPADTQIHLPILTVHRDERFYENPDTFQPDRWTAAFEEELPEFAFLPFGGGRRMCVGQEFARLEAMLVLATIGQHWTLEWEGSASGVTLEPEITLESKDGLPMRLQSR